MTVRAPPAPDAVLQRLAQSRPVVGRLARVALFTVVLAGLKNQLWWQTGVVLALLSVFPEQRKRVLVLAAACWVYLVPPMDTKLLRMLAPAHGAAQWVGTVPNAAVVVGVCLFAWAYAWLVRRFPASLPGRRPVLGLVVCLVALFAAATQTPLRGGWWFLVAASAMVLAHYVWFFAYWLADSASSRVKTPRALQMGFWRPFWGFTNVPYGKGAAYLERVEARTEEQLVAVQLKGLKLLLWATVLTVLQEVIEHVIYGRHVGMLLGGSAHGLIPTYDMALTRQIAGDPYPWALRWLALFGSFGLSMLWLTIFGHTIIATCRVAGFDAYRNTYRPLSATSIAEFYNRFYYYFKELLVAFFFYPTYLRYFKRHDRVRLFVATLMAAGLGNFLFHFLRDYDNIFQRGLWGALVVYLPYALYALVLGTAIGLSQLRHGGRRRSHAPWWRKAVAVGGVLIFFCLLGILDAGTIFGERRAPRTIPEYATYLMSLFRP